MKKLSAKRAILVAAVFGFGTIGSVNWSGSNGFSVSVDSAQARVGRPLTPVSAAGVREAGTARPVYELWDTAGVLPAAAAAPCGRGTRVGSSAAWGVEDGDVRHG